MGMVTISDSSISIIDGAKHYVDSLAGYAADAQAEMPLPEGIVTVRYSQEKGGAIIISNGENQTEIKNSALKQKLDWCIGAVDSLLARQVTRTALPPPSPPIDPKVLLAEQEAARSELAAVEIASAMAKAQAAEERLVSIETRLTALEKAKAK